jgi:hypothetical protein
MKVEDETEKPKEQERYQQHLGLGKWWSWTRCAQTRLSHFFPFFRPRSFSNNTSMGSAGIKVKRCENKKPPKDEERSSGKEKLSD